MPDEQRKPARKRASKSTSRAQPAQHPETEYSDEDGGPGKHRGEAVGAHADFVARHFGGGVQATPELLDRALDVWKRLPGAVVGGPAQIRPNRPVVAPDGEDVAS